MSDQDQSVRGVVDRVMFTGSIFQVYVTVGGSLEIRGDVPIEDMVRNFGVTVPAGTGVTVSWTASDVVFVEDTGSAVDLTQDVRGSDPTALTH